VGDGEEEGGHMRKRRRKVAGAGIGRSRVSGEDGDMGLKDMRGS